MYIGAKVRTNSFFGWGNGTIWIDEVNCDGTESSLYNCGYSSTLNNSCSYNTLAGVTCQSMTNVCHNFFFKFLTSKGGGTCTNQDIRIISPLNSKSEGRIEVCVNYQWGTVCDDGWGSTDGYVACKQLGFYAVCKC